MSKKNVERKDGLIVPTTGGYAPRYHRVSVKSIRKSRPKRRTEGYLKSRDITRKKCSNLAKKRPKRKSVTQKKK